MRKPRVGAALGALGVEAALAALTVLFYYGFIAEYGDVTDSSLEGLRSGFSWGVGVTALFVVGVPAVLAVFLSSERWVRLAALTMPGLMVVAMFGVTPAALQKKLEDQYDAVPRCVGLEDYHDSGLGSRVAQESQKAFDSIEHVGHFSGGGASGVDGCDAGFVLTEYVDVLEHYRAALREAEWTVVEDDADHLRAERDGMAFEVSWCGRKGFVWAGPVDADAAPRCSEQ